MFNLSVGRPDALLTLDLGSTKLVKAVALDWRHPASSLMLPSFALTGDAGPVNPFGPFRLLSSSDSAFCFAFFIFSFHLAASQGSSR